MIFVLGYITIQQQSYRYKDEEENSFLLQLQQGFPIPQGKSWGKLRYPGLTRCFGRGSWAKPKVCDVTEVSITKCFKLVERGSPERGDHYSLVSFKDNTSKRRKHREG